MENSQDKLDLNQDAKDALECSRVAKTLSENDSAIDYNTAFHTLMNLKISPEQRLSQGIKQ